MQPICRKRASLPVVNTIVRNACREQSRIGHAIQYRVHRYIFSYHVLQHWNRGSAVESSNKVAIQEHKTCSGQLYTMYVHSTTCGRCHVSLRKCSTWASHKGFCHTAFWFWLIYLMLLHMRTYGPLLLVSVPTARDVSSKVAWVGRFFTTYYVHPTNALATYYCTKRAIQRLCRISIAGAAAANLINIPHQRGRVGSTASGGNNVPAFAIALAIMTPWHTRCADASPATILH